MHENIKYSIKLDHNTEELISIDQINNRGPKKRIADWQSIFSNNAYGTHHFAYCKFIGNQANDSFKVNLIQIYIENYTGWFTIGLNKFIDIIEIAPDSEDEDDRYPDRKKYLLILGMEAMRGELKDRVILDYTPDDLTLNDGDLLVTTAFYTPFKPDVSKIYSGIEAMKKSSLIDDLFMQRIGSDVNVSLDGMVNLLLLHDLVPNIVTEENLRSVIDPDDTELMEKLEIIKKAKLIKNSQYGNEYPVAFPFIETITGIEYPCIPTNSIFYHR